MLKRPSVLPKSQKTTFYAVFTFVSDVSTFLLVKSGKTALHGRFRSRPSPPPLCSRSRSEAHAASFLCLISALAACPGAASFLSLLAQAAAPPPSRLLPLRDAHAASSRSPPSSTAPAPRPVASQERDVVARERRSPRRKLPQAPQARTGAGSGTGTRLPSPP